MQNVTSKILLATAFVTTLSSVALADETDFFKLNNPTDPAFNQLLGINGNRTIVGYYGDGNTVANVGYTLVPQNHYSIENFTALPNSLTVNQLQVIGVNNRTFPAIVGFVTDSATNTHGFVDVDGKQAVVDNPLGILKTPPSTQNLLGINDHNLAAGFYLDTAGNSHGFLVQFGWDASHNITQSFTPVDFPGATSTQATGVNNRNEICGFYTVNGANHGFFGRVGYFKTVDVVIKGVTVISTTIFGCNDRGELVGTYTASDASVHGFVGADHRFFNFDAPGSSQTAAFNVQGTIINGINNQGDFVGFFSDGANVNGFVKFR